jgi:hypothetical protein
MLRQVSRREGRRKGIGQKERANLERRGSTSSSTIPRRHSMDGKTCPNRGPLGLVRNTLNGATLVRVFHMTATSCIGGRIRPTCIIASGQFSRKGAQRCANTSTRNLFLNATNVPSLFCEWCMWRLCLAKGLIG